MDTGYEMEPERVGRTRSRRVPALVGTAVLVLAVVIAKPWADATAGTRQTRTRSPRGDGGVAARPTAGPSDDRPGDLPPIRVAGAGPGR